MVKINELRIGNLLNIHGEASTIQIGWFYAAAQNNLPPHEAISLTEEWLERTGADPMQDDGRDPDGWRLFYPAPYNESGKDYFCIWADDPYLVDNFSMAPLKYVHQLQNLYFALTGKELTIKETL